MSDSNSDTDSYHSSSPDLPNPSPFCCTHLELIPNPSPESHISLRLNLRIIRRFLLKAKAKAKSNPSSILMSSPEATAKALTLCGEMIKVIPSTSQVSGSEKEEEGAPHTSPVSSEAPQTSRSLDPAVKETKEEGEEQATFYVQALLRSPALTFAWLPIDFPSTPSSAQNRFTRSEAAVHLFCGSHGKEYEVEVWEKTEAVAWQLQSSGLIIIVEQGEDGVVSVDMWDPKEEDEEEEDEEEEEHKEEGEKKMGWGRGLIPDKLNQLSSMIFS